MLKSNLAGGLLPVSASLQVSAQSPQIASADRDGLSRQEWALVHTLSPLSALPADATNKYRDSAAAALLGQKLFFEPRLSGPIQAARPRKGNSARSGSLIR